jgi:succinoglycan biosynthesis protein ExoL
MNDTPKVYSILPVLGNSTDSKRIAMLQEMGCRVEAAAFQRDFHSGRSPECAVDLLCKISHGRYFKRLLKFITVLPRIRRGIRRNDLVYASAPDLALLALFSGIGLGKPIFVEVQDLRSIQVATGLKGIIARLIDKFVVNSCDLLIVTAPEFATDYYQKRLRVRTPSLLLENKLEASDRPQVSSNLCNLERNHASQPRRLRIGYFGILRCEWSWQVLETLARHFPDKFEIVVAGHPLFSVNIASRANELRNITFLGPYQSPKDLPALYSNVDLIWACYPGPEEVDPDWRWAQAICRSNRFYESCRFKRPLISVQGSGDATVVKRFDIGLILEDQTVDAVVDVLIKIEAADLNRWQANMNRLPRNIYEYTTEKSDLENAIRKRVAA